VGVLKGASPTVRIGAIRALVTYTPAAVDPIVLVSPADGPTMRADFTVSAPPPATNPPFPDAGSCALDIVLLLALSASVPSGELTSMKTALTGFGTELDGTPTYYSLVRFATTATLGQAWTNNSGTISSAITNTNLVSNGYTNWQQALTVAGEQFGSDP